MVSFNSVHIANPTIPYIPKLWCCLNNLLCTQNTLHTYYNTVAGLSSPKSVRTFHFQKVPFAIGFFKKSFCSEKLNTNFFDVLVSLKEYVTRECLLFLEPYFTENLPREKKKGSLVFIVCLGKGWFFFFLKTCSPGSPTANKGQVSFFTVIGVGLELKSQLSPSLRSYCGIYSNHPSCLPATQLNGTPKKYLSREKATTYFLNSHCFYSSTWKYLFFEKKNNKTHPAVTTIHIPITTKVLEATWLTFALESVQKSIIYPLKQWKMWVSGKLAAGLRDFWEPNVLSEWTVGSSAPIQLRRNLQRLLFTLTIWHAGNSPLVEVVVVLTQSKRGINSWLQRFTHPPLLVLQESWSPKQPWTLEEEGRWKLHQELKNEEKPNTLLWCR